LLPCPFVPALQLPAGGVMAKMAVLRLNQQRYWSPSLIFCARS
jgi:hypothetical protein